MLQLAGLFVGISKSSHPYTPTGGFPPTSLLFGGHAAVPVRGQGPGRRADAVVGAGRVHAVAVLAVGRVLALVYICGAAQVQSRGLILCNDPGSVYLAHLLL